MNKATAGRLALAALLLLVSGGCSSLEAQPRSVQRTPPPPPPEKPPFPAPPPALKGPPPPETAAEGPEPEEASRGVVARAYARKDYRGVVTEFDRVMERYPAHLKGADDLYYLGMSYTFLDDDSRALRTLLEFQYRFPGDPRVGEVLFTTARVFRRLDREDRALDTLRRAESRTEDTRLRVRIHQEKADILAGGGRFLESLSVLDGAYREAGAAAGGSILVSIEKLLTVMPIGLVSGAAAPGGYAFPRELAERVLERRLRPPEAAAAGGPPDSAPLTGAAPQRQTAPGDDADERPVMRIAAVAPGSGRLESYGREVRRGISLALDTLSLPDDPFRIEVVEIDEKAEGGVDKIVRTALAHENLLALVGPLLSNTVERIIEEAERYGLPLFSPTASSPRLNGVSPNFFRNCLTLEMFGESLADLAVSDLGLRTFAILAPDDFYGMRFSEIFEREVLERGGSIVAVQSYDAELTDYAGPIQALKRAAGMPEPPPGRKTRPFVKVPFEAVFLPGSAEQAGLIVPQLAFHDIDPRKIAVLGGNNLNTERFPEVGEEFSEGAMFVAGFFAASPLPGIQRFVAAYRRAYGDDPGTFAAQAYDAAAIILAQARRGATDRRSMLAALAEVRDFPGVTGETTLVPGGLLSRRPFFGVVFKKALVSLSPQRATR